MHYEGKTIACSRALQRMIARPVETTSARGQLDLPVEMIREVLSEPAFIASLS